MVTALEETVKTFTQTDANTPVAVACWPLQSASVLSTLFPTKLSFAFVLSQQRLSHPSSSGIYERSVTEMPSLSALWGKVALHCSILAARLCATALAGGKEIRESFLLFTAVR